MMGGNGDAWLKNVKDLDSHLKMKIKTALYKDVKSNYALFSHFPHHYNKLCKLFLTSTTMFLSPRSYQTKFCQTVTVVHANNTAYVIK